jgi:hypothetical protein
MKMPDGDKPVRRPAIKASGENMWLATVQKCYTWTRDAHAGYRSEQRPILEKCEVLTDKEMQPGASTSDHQGGSISVLIASPLLLSSTAL